MERLANEFIPIVGHVGIVPARATWTGGFRAVGRDADTAIRVYEECKAYQQAGAIAVEIEVVPDEVARAISERLDILLWSMGSGGGCDAQYLFAEDILGEAKPACRAMQKSIGISRPNMSACKMSGWQPSKSFPPTWNPVRSQRPSTWSA